MPTYRNKESDLVVEWPVADERLERSWERISDKPGPESEASWPSTHKELDALGKKHGVPFEDDAKVAEKQEALEAAGLTPGEEE